MITKINKGDSFICIKEVAVPSGLHGISRAVYTKGQIYRSEVTGCITNNQGEKNHEWSQQGVINEYFITDNWVSLSKHINSIPLMEKGDFWKLVGTYSEISGVKDFDTRHELHKERIAAKEADSEIPSYHGQVDIYLSNSGLAIAIDIKERIIRNVPLVLSFDEFDLINKIYQAIKP